MKSPGAIINVTESSRHTKLILVAPAAAAELKPQTSLARLDRNLALGTKTRMPQG